MLIMVSDFFLKRNLSFRHFFKKMLSTSVEKFYVAVLVFAIAIISFFIKVNSLSSFETHVDDLIVAGILKDYREEISQINDIDWYKSKFQLGAISKILNLIPSKEAALNLPVKNILEAIVVSLSTTYAPFQFLVTSLFMDFSQDYKEVIFWGRLPSLLISILIIPILAFVGFRIGGKWGSGLALFSSFFAAFSWEIYIFSSQMENYIIGILGLLFLLVSILCIDKSNSRIEYFIYGLVVSISIWFHYQIVMLLPALFVTYLYSTGTNLFFYKKQFQSFILFWGPIGLSFILIYFFLLRHFVKFGVNWNAGPNNEFLFTLPNQDLLLQIKYITVFFSRNLYYVVTSMTSFVPFNYRYSEIINGSLFLSFLSGVLFSSSLNLDSTFRKFRLFSIVAIVTWLIFILAGKTSFGPTRHSLIYAPIFIIYISLGFTGIISIFLKYKYYNFVVLFILFILYFSVLPNELQRRKDPFSEKGIFNLVQRYKVDLIVSHTSTLNLRLMHLNSVKYIELESGLKKRNYFQINKNPTIMFVSAIRPSSVEEFKSMAEIFDNQSFNINNYSKSFEIKNFGESPLEYSPLTVNGKNGFFVSVYKFKL